MSVLDRKYNSFKEQVVAMSEVAKYLIDCLIERYGENYDKGNMAVLLALIVATYIKRSGVSVEDWMKILEVVRRWMELVVGM
jgi:hypothetical protein